MKKDTEKTFILTDSCAWEAERQSPTGRTDHIIEVIDDETGQVRWIKSGSRIKFVEGEITDPSKQEDYNNQHNEKENNQRCNENPGSSI